MKILQVVREFSPHGGQERYVWELAHALARQGHEVSIFCITNPQKPSVSNISIHEHPLPLEKPRWLNAYLFDSAAEKHLAAHADDYDIIHTHERTTTKHVATLHGPPFAHTRSFPFYKKCSLRYWMNHRLEQQQLLQPHSNHLVCVSELLRAEALCHYPQLHNRPTHVIMPGAAKTSTPRPTHTEPPALGFLGREWKRKGLPLALDIWQEARKHSPELRFVSAGFAPEEHPLGTSLPEACTHLGWLEDIDTFFNQIDILIHPAQAEPFGMVILEALQRGIPVLISDKCGAKSLITSENGRIHSLDTDKAQWADSARNLLNQAPCSPTSRPWKNVAEEHLTLYQFLTKR